MGSTNKERIKNEEFIKLSFSLKVINEGPIKVGGEWLQRIEKLKSGW